MKLLTIAAVIGSLTACGADSSNPTAPTPPAPPANIAGSYGTTLTASSPCSADLSSETRALEFLATVAQTGAAMFAADRNRYCTASMSVVRAS